MPYAERKRKRFNKWRIDLAIHDALAIARKQSCADAFERLLTVVIHQSKMLRPRRIGAHAGWTDAERFLRGLLAICRYRRSWLRDVDGWNAPEASSLGQFGSLAQHLLARQPIPKFMNRVWLEESSEAAHRHQKLFKHIGLGNSVRGTDLPIRLTRSMAQFFLQAPDHLTVEQAIRWSQIRGLGGDNQFAAAVLSTRLGSVFERELFWARALQLLIAQPRLEVEMVPPIIDFMDAHRGAFVVTLYHQEFGRSFGSFLASVQKWMDRNPNYGRRAKLRWPNSSIRGFRYVEPQASGWSVRCWTIQELTNSRQLIDEGNYLHHCVASYAEACAKRATSIWSLQCHGSLESHRVLTIEVCPKERKIVTALGKCNSRPKRIAREVMEMWADQEGLAIGPRV